MATTELHFEIFLVFLGVRRVDLEVFLNLVHLEIVDRHTFTLIEGSFHVHIELFGEVVGIINSENSLIEVDILCHIEIFPVVKFLHSNLFGDFLSVNEDALGDSGILHAGFGDVDGFVVQIVIHDARTDTVIF